MTNQKEIQKVTEEPQHVEVVAIEANAIEVMERASVDIQVVTAHKFPRDIDKFIDAAKKMVAVDEETAESCIYRRPVGRDDDSAGQKFVEGESIRLAEIVASTYTNLRVGAVISEIGLRYVKAIGFAHDLESNYAAKAEVVESTVKKSGKPYTERMRLVTGKVAQSKAIRDAIFRVVPKSLCKPITEEARRIILGKERPLKERRQAVALWLSKLSIDEVRVFTALGIKSLNDIGNKELEELTGIRTALKDGDITIDEAFPPLNFKEKEQQTQQKIDEQTGSEQVDIDKPTTDKKQTKKAKKKIKKKQMKAQRKEVTEPEPEPKPKPTEEEAKPVYQCQSRTCKHETTEPEERTLRDGSKIYICPRCLTTNIKIKK